MLFRKVENKKNVLKEEIFFFENEEYWNLEVDFLKPLKKFLLVFLKK